MSDNERVGAATTEPDDTQAILGRRSLLRSRLLTKARKLVAAGVAVGAVAGSGCTQPSVCLMPPPNYECPGPGSSTAAIRNAVRLDAAWQLRDQQWRVAVSLTITVPAEGDHDTVVFTESPQLGGAALGSYGLEPRSLDFVCEPDPATTSVDVVIPMTCEGHSETLHFALALSDDPDEETPIPVTWLD